MRAVLLALSLVACRPTPVTQPAEPRSNVSLTYLGVAGWQLDAGDVTVLVDPYFSRPKLDGPVVSDAAAIAARAPKRADLIVVGHSHVDHLLDAPAVALATGAQLLGSASTARFARASGLAEDRIIPVRGGEDYQMRGFSVRVIPSLHSALDDKHTLGEPMDTTLTVPMKFVDFAEGGTFAYLVRVAGHQVLFLGTANFIERELEGLRPDVAVVATGLRQEIFNYTCRLMRALGQPPLVIANHFDDWQAAPVDEPPSDDMQEFVAEVARCSPNTRVVVPRHFIKLDVD